MDGAPLAPELSTARGKGRPCGVVHVQTSAAALWGLVRSGDIYLDIYGSISEQIQAVKGVTKHRMSSTTQRGQKKPWLYSAKVESNGVKLGARRRVWLCSPHLALPMDRKALVVGFRRSRKTKAGAWIQEGSVTSRDIPVVFAPISPIGQGR